GSSPSALPKLPARRYYPFGRGNPKIYEVACLACQHLLDFDHRRRHVKTLMRRMGIEALYRRPRTTQPEPGHKIYPYPLRSLDITRPNQVWAMDITYIPMARGFVYLAVALDWFSRRVLSWRVSITMEASLCIETLEEALAKH